MQVPLELATEAGRLGAQSCNISASGVLFSTEPKHLSRLRPGRSLTVILRLTDPATVAPACFEARGRVVRIEIDRDDRLLVAAALTGLQFAPVAAA